MYQTIKRFQIQMMRYLHLPYMQKLDRSLLIDVLGITSASVLRSMQTLRDMLCAEPNIHGGNQSTCELDAELAGLKKKGIAFPSWYDGQICD